MYEKTEDNHKRPQSG